MPKFVTLLLGIHHFFDLFFDCETDPPRLVKATCRLVGVDCKQIVNYIINKLET